MDQSEHAALVVRTLGPLEEFLQTAALGLREVGVVGCTHKLRSQRQNVKL